MNTDELRQQATTATLEVERRAVFGVGPAGAKTSLCLDDDATLRTRATAEIRARTLVAAGTETTAIKGSACEVGGEVVSVVGKRVGIDADSRIELSTPGQVDVRGQEKITLN